MTEKPSKETLAAWSADPKNWKWGLFYYNKQDKRIMPPKKNPAMGYTINFGHKKSVITFLFFMLLPTAIIFLIMLATRK